MQIALESKFHWNSPRTFGAIDTFLNNDEVYRMKLLSQVRRMPSHIFFFTERDGEYFKVMIQKNGRILEISLGLVRDYLSYEYFVLFVSKFIPANYFLVVPVHLENLHYETILDTASAAGALGWKMTKSSPLPIQ